jgi:ring-1,2-phenylacetyl-CoA epoxidase subunit PaaE
MAQSFIPLRVRDLVKTTPDCTLVEFDVPQEAEAQFSFHPGQHLTLRTTLRGEEIRRTYSLCSAPSEKRWCVAIKRIDNGRFSTFINTSLKVGDVLDVSPPAGNFFVPPAPGEKRRYAAFAAGSGITPILSMMKGHLEAEPDCHFSLFYSNSTSGSIILKEEIESLKNRFLNRLEVYYLLTQEERDIPLFSGRLDTAKLNQITSYLLDPAKLDHIFLCGPEEMIFFLRDYFLAKGLPEKHIHFELFYSFAGQKKAEKRAQESFGQAQNTTEVTLIEGGKSLRFTMARGSESVLDVALRKNANLPFACKGGVCCTCKAKLLEGKVDMEVNYALEKEQLEAGYILTCQSTPLTDRIVVDFDQ